ncbi:MAG TPA: DNA-3-methyladenine glycosylase 2 family protein [Candidatus Paceibacterota bacterium]|nr:DNA-3-methyladenine glycosylase 2 family protein [Candidatus Paceibacterota bacterium]
MKKLKINPKKLRKLSPSKNHFASLARSIIYQQLSGASAAAIERKFFGLFDPKVLNMKGKRGKLLPAKFPKPAQVLKLTDAQFKSAGLSGQKMSYMRDLARKFIDGTIEPKKFPKMTDEEIIEHLTAVKGIGVWTAHMFLIFALNRPDVLPVGDLGIKKGFQRAFKLRKLPDEEKMRKLAKPHAGEHTALSLHLWAIADDQDYF